MRALKIIGIGCGGLVALFVIVLIIAGFAMSSAYRVERSVAIDAPPEAVHAYVGDLRRWPEWMPWDEELDPTMTTSFEGSGSEVGSTMSWSGDSLGNGTMTLTATDPASGMQYQLDLPEMQTPGTGSFAYQVAGETTTVVWVDTGDVSSGLATPLMKLMRPALEAVLGTHFEKGLGKLKTAVEADG